MEVRSPAIHHPVREALRIERRWQARRLSQTCAGSCSSAGVHCGGLEIARGIGESHSRWPKRRAGVAESVPTNPPGVEGWLSEKHAELRGDRV